LQFPLALLCFCICFPSFLIDVGGTLYSPYPHGVIEHLHFFCENHWSGTHTSKEGMEISGLLYFTSFMRLGLLWGWCMYKTGYNNSAFIRMRSSICDLGVLTEWQTSSKFCFENVVENFEMLKRAFRDRREDCKFLSGFSSWKTGGPHWRCWLPPGILLDDR
jgi:hypothetical protein